MVDLLQIIERLVGYLPSFYVLLYILSFLIGGIMVMVALRNAARRNEAGPNGGSWAAPFWTFTIGVLFVALPGLVSSVTLSIFGVSFEDIKPDPQSIFEYAPATVGLFDEDSPGRAMITGLVAVVQFIGLIAVMRGLRLLNESAQGGGGGGSKTFGPGFTFVIAGVLAVNFPLFVGVMERLISIPAGG
jgi:hypothetical protein